MTVCAPLAVYSKLLVFFFLPLLSLAYIFASEAFFALARSLIPLLMMACSPRYADEISAQREELSVAMLSLLDDDLGWRNEEPDRLEQGGGESDSPGVWQKADWGATWKDSHASSFRREDSQLRLSNEEEDRPRNDSVSRGKLATTATGTKDLL